MKKLPPAIVTKKIRHQRLDHILALHRTVRKNCFHQLQIFSSGFDSRGLRGGFDQSRPNLTSILHFTVPFSVTWLTCPPFLRISRLPPLSARLSSTNLCEELRCPGGSDISDHSRGWRTRDGGGGRVTKKRTEKIAEDWGMGHCLPVKLVLFSCLVFRLFDCF
jgi:hypothetical protein